MSRRYGRGRPTRPDRVLFEITHRTSFGYQEAVVLDPMQIRLRPRSDLCQRLVSFDLVADPAPSGSSCFLDAEANAVTQLWFLGSWTALAIQVTSVVETLCPNPFGYLVLDPAALALPPEYPERAKPALARFLAPPGPAVVDFARSVAGGGAGPGAGGFLSALCATIAATIQPEFRAEGGARPGEETLGLGRGACRDQAVLFVEACRAAGIAARFVTGYDVSGAGEPEGAELHAWAEAYLEGAGWRGFDPSTGLAVADRHVAVAAGPGPADAAPTSGTYRGAATRSRLASAISVRQLSGADDRRTMR